MPIASATRANKIEGPQPASQGESVPPWPIEPAKLVANAWATAMTALAIRVWTGRGKGGPVAEKKSAMSGSSRQARGEASFSCRSVR